MVIPLLDGALISLGGMKYEKRIVVSGNYFNGGEVVAIDPSTKNILRRLDTEYEPVQLEWLD